MSSASTSPFIYRSRNVLSDADFLDIDRPPSNSRLYHLTGYRVQAAEMLPTSVKNFYLAVQGVPRIEPPSAITPPTPLTMRCSQILELVQDRRAPDWFSPH